MARLRLRTAATTLWAIAAGLGRTLWGKHEAMSELKVGDPAPDFSLAGSDGATYRLSDFAGATMVVVAWFPKAFTGG